MALKCISECQTFYKAGHTTYYMLAMPLFACALDLPHDLGTLDASVPILDSMHSIFIRITIALKEKVWYRNSWSAFLNCVRVIVEGGLLTGDFTILVTMTFKFITGSVYQELFLRVGYQATIDLGRLAGVTAWDMAYYTNWQFAQHAMPRLKT